MKYCLQILLALFIFSCSTNEKKSGETESNSIVEEPKVGLQWTNEIKDPKIALEVKREVLDNGLTVLLARNPPLPLFSFYPFYKVGSRYEDLGMTGASHFLEHLMFKGAKKYGPGQFDSIIEENGGSNNAYTTSDLTVYYENLPTGSLSTIIDLEADRMDNLLLAPESFEKERAVILEERKMRYENSPQGKLFLEMFLEMFKGTPYGNSIIGRIADLKSVSRDQIQAYFKQFYVPNNAIVVIVGDIDVDKTLAQIKKSFGSIPFSDATEKIKETKDNPKNYLFKTSFGRSIKLKGSSVNPLFSLVYKGEALGKRRGFVMDIVASILGDGSSSYLVQKYVNGKKPLLSNIYVANYNLEKNGLFFISGELLKTTKLKWFENKLKREIRSVCQEAITDRSVQKTKNQYLVEFYNSLQTNAGIAGFLGIRQATYGDYNYYQTELETYAAISTNEVKQVCNEIFSSHENLFFSVWDRHL